MSNSTHSPLTSDAWFDSTCRQLGTFQTHCASGHSLYHACRCLLVQELRSKLLDSKALKPFYRRCAVIFGEMPYPSVLHMHGAMLEHLKKANRGQVYMMFSSKDKGEEFWKEFEGKVSRRHPLPGRGCSRPARPCPCCFLVWYTQDAAVKVLRTVQHITAASAMHRVCCCCPNNGCIKLCAPH